MRAHDRMLADARRHSPFANHSEFEIFSYNICRGCVHDHPQLGCPIIDLALQGLTATELIVDERGRTTGCTAHEDAAQRRAREKKEDSEYRESTFLGDLFNGIGDAISGALEGL